MLVVSSKKFEAKSMSWQVIQRPMIKTLSCSMGWCGIFLSRCHHDSHKICWTLGRWLKDKLQAAEWCLSLFRRRIGGNEGGWWTSLCEHQEQCSLVKTVRYFANRTFQVDLFLVEHLPAGQGFYEQIPQSLHQSDELCLRSLWGHCPWCRQATGWLFWQWIYHVCPSQSSKQARFLLAFWLTKRCIVIETRFLSQFFFWQFLNLCT